MTKKDMYQIKDLLVRIDNDFKNDWPRNPKKNRAELIAESVNKGIELCDKYLTKMKP